MLRVPGDRPTVQSAVDSATDGDTIVVSAGVHVEESILIDGKSVTLEGACSDARPLISVIRLRCTDSHLTLRRLQIEASEPAAPPLIGVDGGISVSHGALISTECEFSGRQHGLACAMCDVVLTECALTGHCGLVVAGDGNRVEVSRCRVATISALGSDVPRLGLVALGALAAFRARDCDVGGNPDVAALAQAGPGDVMRAFDVIDSRLGGPIAVYAGTPIMQTCIVGNRISIGTGRDYGVAIGLGDVGGASSICRICSNTISSNAATAIALAGNNAVFLVEGNKLSGSGEHAIRAQEHRYTLAGKDRFLSAMSQSTVTRNDLSGFVASVAQIRLDPSARGNTISCSVLGPCPEAIADAGVCNLAVGNHLSA